MHLSMMHMHLICSDCTDSFTYQCLAPGAQDDTEHLRNTCHSKFFLHLSRCFPCKQVPALVWSTLFELHFRVKQKWVFSLSIYIIPPSPVLGWDIHIAARYLSVCLPADLSHIRPWPAVQYCMEGASSTGGEGGGVPYSILMEESTQLLQDSRIHLHKQECFHLWKAP